MGHDNNRSSIFNGTRVALGGSYGCLASEVAPLIGSVLQFSISITPLLKVVALPKALVARTACYDADKNVAHVPTVTFTHPNSRSSIFKGTRVALGGSYGCLASEDTPSVGSVFLVSMRMPPSLSLVRNHGYDALTQITLCSRTSPSSSRGSISPANYGGESPAQVIRGRVRQAWFFPRIAKNQGIKGQGAAMTTN